MSGDGVSPPPCFKPSSEFLIAICYLLLATLAPKERGESYHQVYRPEAEGKWALPKHEFGLDVIAYAGSLRYQEHRTVPEIHQVLREKGVSICQRTVGHVLDRYDELLSVSVTDKNRIKKLLGSQKQVILALDGLQPQVGQEVLWVIRDCRARNNLISEKFVIEPRRRY